MAKFPFSFRSPFGNDNDRRDLALATNFDKAATEEYVDAAVAGSSGGVADHGLLTGLADDDHTQYHTDARGDARYFTQAQVTTSLAGKANTAHTHAQADVTNLVSDLALKAPLASPSLTGTPTAPTAAEGTNTTQIASTAFVQTATGSASSNRPAATAYRNISVQPVASSGTMTLCTFDTEGLDTDGMYSSAAPNRLTFSTAGNYTVTGTLELGAHATGVRYTALVHRNSAGVALATYLSDTTLANVSVNYGGNITEQVTAAAGDYVQLYVFQNSGSSLNLTWGNGTYACRLSAFFTGGTGAAWGNAGAAATKSAAQSPANNTWTPILFDTESLDIDGMHSTSSNTDRLTCVTPGTYIFTGSVSIASSATGARAARIMKNGATLLAYSESPPVSGDVTGLSVASIPVQMAVGDYVTFDAYQNSGGALAITTSNTMFGGLRVGYQTNPNNRFQVVSERATRYASGIGTTAFYIGAGNAILYPTSSGASAAQVYIDPADWGGSSAIVKLRAWCQTEVDPTDSTLTVTLYRMTGWGAGGTLGGASSVVAMPGLSVTVANTTYQGVSDEATITTAGWYVIGFAHNVNPAQAMTYGYTLLVKAP